MPHPENKVMTKNANPFAAFDMSKFAADFDPSKMVNEFTKMAGTMDLKTVDVDSIIKSQQKNLEALNAANTAVVEGVKAVAQRQSEIFNTTLADTQVAISKMTDIKSPQDVAAKQAELVKGAFETSLSNMRELADMVAKSNTESAAKINARITESLDEYKAEALKLSK
jgi:phasin family protein